MSDIQPEELRLPGTITAPDLPAEVPAPVKFHEKHKEAFEGLLYLGRLEKTFDWAGHNFKIRTLTTSDELEIGNLIRPYSGSSQENRAWWAARAAAALVLVDGKSLPAPLSEAESELEAKFAWVLKLYPWVLDGINAQLLELGLRVEEAVEELGKTSGDQTPTSGTPSTSQSTEVL